MSLDRFPVRAQDRTIECLLRGRRVAIDECDACPYKERVDPTEPPRFVVCDARYVLGALGLDQDL